MVYFTSHRKTVTDGAVLEWVVQGRPGREANIKVRLQVNFVALPDAHEGITLDVVTDDAISITALQPAYDTTQHHGQVVWLKGYNGVVLEFEGDTYLLFKVESVEPGLEGDIYFHILPTAFGDGDIVYSERQWLE